MKLKSIIEAVLFGIMAIPIFYSAMSTALGSSFRLSPANTEYALLRGFIYGIAIAITVGILQVKRKPKLIVTSRIFGVIALVLLYVGTYCYVAAVASC